jgi:hypothetical protein
METIFVDRVTEAGLLVQTIRANDLLTHKIQRFSIAAHGGDLFMCTKASAAFLSAPDSGPTKSSRSTCAGPSRGGLA